MGERRRPDHPGPEELLDNLARQTGEELPADMSKAEASQHIERLKAQLGSVTVGCPDSATP